MRKEYLLEMSAGELDAYAEAIGIDASKMKTVKAKASLIEKRRERVARVRALGIEVLVPVKAMHDKRMLDRIDSIYREGVSDEELYKTMVDLLGQEQVDALFERATEEDGTVDVDAIGYAFSAVIRSPEVKNF